MQKPLVSDLDESWNNIFQNPHCFDFSELPFVLEESTQVALVAEFRDNVAMRNLPDNIVALEYVAMMNCFQGFDLAF